MTMNIYEVHKIAGYKIPENANINYDFKKDYEDRVKQDGFAIRDYILSDSEFKGGEIIWNGSLCKIIQKVSSFEAKPMEIVTGEK